MYRVYELVAPSWVLELSSLSMKPMYVSATSAAANASNMQNMYHGANFIQPIGHPSRQSSVASGGVSFHCNVQL